MILALALICSIVFVGPAWSASAGPEEPTILGDQVVFVGGKVVRFTASTASPPDAPTRSGDVVSATERPVVLKSLRRVVIVREERYDEGGGIQISVYDFSGALRGQSQNVAREAEGLFFLEASKRIFLGQSSRHVKVDVSLLYDENCRLVRRIPQPADVASFGHSQDERLIWIVSNIWIPPGKKVGELRVIDTEGNVIFRRAFDRAETVTVQHKGQTYSIAVEVPSLP